MSASAVLSTQSGVNPSTSDTQDLTNIRVQVASASNRRVDQTLKSEKKTLINETIKHPSNLGAIVSAVQTYEQTKLNNDVGRLQELLENIHAAYDPNHDYTKEELMAFTKEYLPKKIRDYETYLNDILQGSPLVIGLPPLAKTLAPFIVHTIMTNLQAKVSDKLGEGLSEDDINEIEAMLQEAAGITGKIKEVADDIETGDVNELLKDTPGLLSHLKNLTKNWGPKGVAAITVATIAFVGFTYPEQIQEVVAWSVDAVKQLASLVGSLPYVGDAQMFMLNFLVETAGFTSEYAMVFMYGILGLTLSGLAYGIYAAVYACAHSNCRKTKSPEGVTQPV